MIYGLRTLQRELAEYDRLMARDGGKPEDRVRCSLRFFVAPRPA